MILYKKIGLSEIKVQKFPLDPRACGKDATWRTINPYFAEVYYCDYHYGRLREANIRKEIDAPLTVLSMDEKRICEMIVPRTQPGGGS